MGSTNVIIRVEKVSLKSGENRVETHAVACKLLRIKDKQGLLRLQ